jgi:pSer/pThr/pTyr-binding forkhead associated (FHA) protein
VTVPHLHRMNSAMDVRLLVAHNKPDAKQIALGPETLIGRSPECNLRIASGQVSRKHCVIKIADGHVSVRDLGSANGTRLNGQTISTEEDVHVAPGSTLVVGPLKFIVQFTAPRLDEDTELLVRSSAGSPDLHELQQMATAPVVDGEETKDYPPSRTRKRGDGPPLVVSDKPTAESDQKPGEAGNQRRARTTEAEFEAVSNETVFDGVLEGQSPDRGEGLQSPIGGGTDLFLEEDDVQRLAASGEGTLHETPAAESGAVPPDQISREGSEKQTGWRLLDMLRRKKKPGGPESPGSSGDDDTDENLRNFLKDT